MSFQELRERLPGLQHSPKSSEWLNCVDYRYEDQQSRTTFTVKDEIVSGVIYATDVYGGYGFLRMRKLRYFLQQNASDSPMAFVLDNGFGYTFRSSDGKRMATYSYMMDIFATYYSSLERNDRRGDQENG